ncbi:MAG: hypothetical protein WEG56_00025, partial [Chloroflexota bacterium]
SALVTVERRVDRVELRGRAPLPSVVVDEPAGTWRADVVVGADGEPSRTGRQLGLGRPPRRRSLALEIDVPFAPAVRRDTAILRYAIPGGYGWYLPKGDHANVGVGSYRPSRHGRLREDLGRLAAELDLDLRDGQVRGHWLA